MKYHVPSCFLLMVFITVTENKLKKTDSWKHESDQAHWGKYEEGSKQGIGPWETNKTLIAGGDRNGSMPPSSKQVYDELRETKVSQILQWDHMASKKAHSPYQYADQIAMCKSYPKEIVVKEREGEELDSSRKYEVVAVQHRPVCLNIY